MVQGRMEFKQRASVSVILEKAEFDAFEEIRWRERLSRSEIGRKAVTEYIKNHAEGNDTFKITEWQDPNFRAMPATASPMIKWKEYIMCNTDEKEDRDLELQCLGIVGLIKEKRKNEKISNSS
jgi:hypothetical protein